MRMEIPPIYVSKPPPPPPFLLHARSHARSVHFLSFVDHGASDGVPCIDGVTTSMHVMGLGVMERVQLDLAGTYICVPISVLGGAQCARFWPANDRSRLVAEGGSSQKRSAASCMRRSGGMIAWRSSRVSATTTKTVGNGPMTALTTNPNNQTVTTAMPKSTTITTSQGVANPSAWYIFFTCPRTSFR